MLFSLVQKCPDLRFWLNDSNLELINAYRVVQNNVDALIESLEKHQNTPEYFYQIRALDRERCFFALSPVERASRMIYLNKTCFNGLFRVNSKGQFNTPFGNYKKPNIVSESTLRACAKALENVKITQFDYSESLDMLDKQSFVYLDPPYEPISESSSFRSYTNTGFDKAEQIRLFEFCQRLTKRKVKFMLSNSSAPWIKALYEKEEAFNVITVSAKRSVNSQGHGRGPVPEIIVRNYR